MERVLSLTIWLNMLFLLLLLWIGDSGAAGDDVMPS